MSTATIVLGDEWVRITDGREIVEVFVHPGNPVLEAESDVAPSEPDQGIPVYPTTEAFKIMPPYIMFIKSAADYSRVTIMKKYRM
ncbi:hypothetical protein HVZ66_15085 [Escherichia fergusonii]|uniref:hypothetical protein n=1 Tax=Escherichia fergusonii TaxID=564 RepID=UPI0015E9ABF6|nr:hypothetical protein [Escherichia fergusonii]QMC78871.1 hypothetical protein HVZ66_15085 [Escherichia fergusonii]HCO7573430.1 hypothetical protein [Escherichia fergusonii]